MTGSGAGGMTYTIIILIATSSQEILTVMEPWICVTDDMILNVVVNHLQVDAAVRVGMKTLETLCPVVGLLQM
jgi:hypothetical protein